MNLLAFLQLIQSIERELVTFRGCIDSIGTQFDSHENRREIRRLRSELKKKVTSAEQNLKLQKSKYVRREFCIVVPINRLGKLSLLVALTYVFIHLPLFLSSGLLVLRRFSLIVCLSSWALMWQHLKSFSRKRKKLPSWTLIPLKMCMNQVRGDPVVKGLISTNTSQVITMFPVATNLQSLECL